MPLDKANNKALEIINNSGLDFNVFFNTATYYEYNINKSRKYKRLSANDYLVLKAVIKREYALLEVLWRNTLEQKMEELLI